jgi:hypothetical protein
MQAHRSTMIVAAVLFMFVFAAAAPSQQTGIQEERPDGTVVVIETGTAELGDKKRQSPAPCVRRWTWR